MALLRILQMTRQVTVQNLDNPAVSPVHARYCNTFLSKLRGFTFRRRLDLREGLILVEKRDSRAETAIHMLFVWTDLAVAWIDSSNTVVDTVLARSWRPFYSPARPARYVLEIHPDRMADFQIGQRVDFKDA
jgi:uncharacterized membrane protein (UPF0127 family)